MVLPSKGLPVVGSVMTTGFPVLSTDFEKSPRRSSSIGIVTNTGSVGVIVCGFSSEKKKNALSLLSFGKSFGTRIGPAKLKPQMLCRYSGFLKPALLVKNGVALKASFRTK